MNMLGTRIQRLVVGGNGDSDSDDIIDLQDDDAMDSDDDVQELSSNIHMRYDYADEVQEIDPPSTTAPYPSSTAVLPQPSTGSSYNLRARSPRAPSPPTRHQSAYSEKPNRKNSTFYKLGLGDRYQATIADLQDDLPLPESDEEREGVRDHEYGSDYEYDPSPSQRTDAGLFQRD